MTRPPRCDFPGSWHHVMNRGLAHRPVFEVREDIRYFLSRIAQAVRRGEIEVHAWCLMTTHFHLLVYSPRGEIDVALRRIQHEHTRRFNRRRGRDGTLYRSRFTSKPVDSFAYLQLLIGYIDANPVAAGMVTDAPLHIDGSASWYARTRGPVWMERSWVEGEVRRRTRKDAYDPRDYSLVFGAPIGPGARRLIEQRLRHAGRRDDPTDDLLASTPEHVARWLVERAALADGLSPGVPLTDPLETLELVRAHRARDPYRNTRPTRTISAAWDLMEAGLVRTLCNSTYVEMTHLTGLSESKLSGRCRRHALAVERDPSYAAIAAKITREILWRTYHQHEEQLSPR